MSESIRDYMLTGDWKTSTGGMTAMAQKEGRKFFLKKYKNPVQPNTADIAAGRISKKTYEANKTRFDSFVSARSKINEFLSTKAGMGGNIILPLEWFVDANLYVEASEFVSGLISDDEIIRLPYENKKLVMLTATSALASVHKLGIVHGDLKATNILGAKNAAGNYVAKIIDFDCSYFMTEKPKNDIGGDQVYAAPELGLCWMSEMEPEYVKQLSAKSDIFSLGLVFHRYITGELPQPKSIPKEMQDKYKKGSAIYPWEVLLYDEKLTVSPKVKEPYLVDLIDSMLQTKPELRPDAADVLDFLKGGRTSAAAARIPEAGGAKKAPIPAATAKETPATEPVKSPPVETAAPRTPYVPKTPLAASKPTAPKGFAAPWPEHAIAWLPDKIAGMRFVSCEQTEAGGKHCYRFFRADGTGMLFTIEKLAMLGLTTPAGRAASAAKVAEPVASPPPAPAKTAPPSGEKNVLWEEDAAYAVDAAALARDGYDSIVRTDKGGKKGYLAVAAGGRERFMPLQTLLMLGYLKRN